MNQYTLNKQKFNIYTLALLIVCKYPIKLQLISERVAKLSEINSATILLTVTRILKYIHVIRCCSIAFQRLLYSLEILDGHLHNTSFPQFLVADHKIALKVQSQLQKIIAFMLSQKSELEQDLFELGAVSVTTDSCKQAAFDSSEAKFGNLTAGRSLKQDCVIHTRSLCSNLIHFSIYIKIKINKNC